MVMRFPLFNILLGIIFLLPYPASADDGLTGVKAPESFAFKGYYEFGFAGLRFGKLGFEAEQTPQSYSAIADVASSGVLKLFVRHSSHSTVDATATTRAYESHYQTRKKKRHVKLVMEDGKLIEEVLVPSEDGKRRPLVDQALKEAALDPLSFALAMRTRVSEALQTGDKEFTLHVFDGRRLTEANFTVKGPKVLKLDKQKYSVIAVEVRRKLVAGFTDSELADYDPKEPTLTIYFSNDDRLIPMRLEAPLLVGTLYANLVKQCRSGESCLLGHKPSDY